MATEFYARILGEVHGPFDGAVLKTMASDRRLAPSDEVSRDGHKWTLACEVKGLGFPPAADFQAIAAVPSFAAKNVDLVGCPDCAGLVSPRAIGCPHCGCPLVTRPGPERRYHSLRAISTGYLITGVIGSVVAIVSFVWAMYVAATEHYTFAMMPLITMLGAVGAAITFLAIGEAILVALAIEENTRREDGAKK